MFRNQPFELDLEDIFGIGGPFGPDGISGLINMLSGGRPRRPELTRAEYERAVAESGFDPADIDENDECPGCGEVHLGSGLIAAAKRKDETGTTAKPQHHKDLADAKRGRFTITQAGSQLDMIRRSLGELLYDSVGGDEEKLKMLLGTIKLERDTFDNAGEAATKAAQRISISLGKVAEEKDAEIADLKHQLAEAEAKIEAISERASDMEDETFRIAGNLISAEYVRQAFEYITGDQNDAPVFPKDLTVAEETRRRFRELREVLCAKSIDAAPYELLNAVFFQATPVAELVEKFFPTQQPEVNTDDRSELPVRVEDAEDTLLDLDIPESSPAGITDERPEDRVLDLSEEVAVGAAV